MTKVALIWGAAGGIGRALARKLKDEDWQVIGMSRQGGVGRRVHQVVHEDHGRDHLQRRQAIANRRRIEQAQGLAGDKEPGKEESVAGEQHGGDDVPFEQAALRGEIEILEEDLAEAQRLRWQQRLLAEARRFTGGSRRRRNAHGLCLEPESCAFEQVVGRQAQQRVAGRALFDERQVAGISL